MSTSTTKNLVAQQLSLPEELILALLNEESGYFHQVPGWDLNCAFAGAVLAELSFLSRIDMDMESLFLTDGMDTGNPILDPSLQEIAKEPDQRSVQYWIERLAPQAESVIDLTLERLVDMELLEHHDGEFWTLARTAWQAELSGRSVEGSVGQFVKTRIVMAVFNNEIPTPRDAVIISLMNTCDVFRFMFEMDKETEDRIGFISNMDIIGRSIANAVSQHVVGSFLRPSRLDREIPPGAHAQGIAESPPAHRTHSGPVRGLVQRVWAGVPAASSLLRAADLPGGAGDEPVGQPERADSS